MHDRPFYELKLYDVQCLILWFLQLYHKLKIKNKNDIILVNKKGRMYIRRGSHVGRL